MRSGHGNYSTTADPIAQPQVLVIAHATGVFTVIMDQRIQARAQLRRLGTKAFQAGDDLLHLAGFEIDADLPDPLIGLRRAFAETQAGEVSGVFHGVPEIEDLATANKPCSKRPP